MRDGIEIRPNGVKITTLYSSSFLDTKSYKVEGSSNGPWTYLRSARYDADHIHEPDRWSKDYMEHIRTKQTKRTNSTTK